MLNECTQQKWVWEFKILNKYKKFYWRFVKPQILNLSLKWRWLWLTFYFFRFPRGPTTNCKCICVRSKFQFSFWKCRHWPRWVNRIIDKMKFWMTTVYCQSIVLNSHLLHTTLNPSFYSLNLCLVLVIYFLVTSLEHRRTCI